MLRPARVVYITAFILVIFQPSTIDSIFATIASSFTSLYTPLIAGMIVERSGAVWGLGTG